ncbi:MAG: hypothetical protein IOC82_16100 [Aestuariivirga sp.]|uniref:hypothetical protein n=1 Tax=Aestuariivirga sp. TaxID=2650926 RepID=UPI0025C12096|nr:hypothetical protein [Aestuariivirga sp.]MCA3562540.1 hypothetical protein [Aestuariivirga sp.]
MPAPVLLPNRPILPRLLLLFWVAEIAVGVLFAVAGYGLLGPSGNGGAAVLILMGLVLAVAGAVMAGHCWRSARLTGNAIEMTEAGLMDRRLSAHPIPWEAISWKVIFNGRSYALQMDVAEPAQSAAQIAWSARALGLFSRLLRQPEFNVAALGTGLSAHDIGQRMAAFKPPTA